MSETTEYNRAYHAIPENKARKKYKRTLRGPIHRRNEHLKLEWNITPEEYEAMCASQHHRCAICGKQGSTSTSKYQKLHIDHDHVTGEIRGMLCNSCNRGLGLFKDNPGLLIMAADYLAVPR